MEAIKGETQVASRSAEEVEAIKGETPAASRSAEEVEGGGGARGTDVLESRTVSTGTSLQKGSTSPSSTTREDG